MVLDAAFSSELGMGNSFATLSESNERADSVPVAPAPVSVRGGVVCARFEARSVAPLRHIATC